jgi:hypothetical protein
MSVLQLTQLARSSSPLISDLQDDTASRANIAPIRYIPFSRTEDQLNYVQLSHPNIRNIMYSTINAFSTLMISTTVPDFGTCSQARFGPLEPVWLQTLRRKIGAWKASETKQSMSLAVAMRSRKQLDSILCRQNPPSTNLAIVNSKHTLRFRSRSAAMTSHNVQSVARLAFTVIAPPFPRLVSPDMT